MIIGRLFLCFELLFGITQATSGGACGADDAWSVRTGNAYITLNNDFTANINGSTSDGQYTISVANSKGTIVQGNRATSVIVNIEIPRTSAYAIYNFIGSDSNGFLTGRAYCTPSGQLTDLWLEDTSSNTGIKKTGATGTCNIGKPSQSYLYQVYDECLLIDKPATYPSIQGTQISLQPDKTGSIILNQNYTLLPFNVIDCKNCGKTPQDGWIEIHSLLNYGSSVSDICMGILYLYVQQAPVTLSWLNCFQPQQPNATFDATYDIQNFNTNTTGSVNVTTIDAAATTSSATAGATASAATDEVTDIPSNGLSTGAKIGIGIGVSIFVLIVIAVSALVLLRRRKARQNPLPAHESLSKSVAEVSDKKAMKPHYVELDQNERTNINEAPDSQRYIELDGTSQRGV
ncbi:MAG: hypothetical protein GOMPHAMPRED_006362 [Gomphillus americanus]|uniref:Uncharacterized protein n=1 Tax=Gomphillus americanus TaxID=1940652 RepID=A0A8H3EN35_9LECA|nr:MAG: hypothetical protein GOMPHAMPRED_006362 [Gomphillus americanus]